LPPPLLFSAVMALPSFMSMSPVTWILIGHALGFGESSQVMLPAPVMVRLPLTLKTPSTVPSEASAAAKVVGALIVTSASVFLLPAPLFVEVGGETSLGALGSGLAAAWPADGVFQIPLGFPAGDPNPSETPPATTRSASPTFQVAFTLFT